MGKPAYPVTEQITEVQKVYGARVAETVRGLEQAALWAKEAHDTDQQSLREERKRAGELETDLARTRMDVDFWRERAESLQRQLASLGVTADEVQEP